MGGVWGELRVALACIHRHVPYTAGRELLHSVRSSALRSVRPRRLGRWRGGRKEAQEEGNICVRTGDLCCFTAETSVKTVSLKTVLSVFKLTQQCKATPLQLKIKIISEPDITKVLLILSTSVNKVSQILHLCK